MGHFGSSFQDLKLKKKQDYFIILQLFIRKFALDEDFNTKTIA